MSAVDSDVELLDDAAGVGSGEYRPLLAVWGADQLRDVLVRICLKPGSVTMTKEAMLRIIAGIASDNTDESHYCAMIVERLYVCVCGGGGRGFFARE